MQWQNNGVNPTTKPETMNTIKIMMEKITDKIIKKLQGLADAAGHNSEYGKGILTAIAIIEYETEIVKNGMYGETQKVKIGKFTIAMMSDKDDEESVWIEDTEGGEGGQFNGEQIQEDLQKIFDKHF